MSKIVRLGKRLLGPGPLPTVPGITIRAFRDGSDVGAWLQLRAAAWAGLTTAGRPWTPADFVREFQTKPWWSPERMWLACSGTADDECVVGSITLGRSGRAPHDRACVQWLMVSPEVRRRGVGRQLLASLEASAWSQGDRELVLETHADWSAALRLYESCGYATFR